LVPEIPEVLVSTITAQFPRPVARRHLRLVSGVSPAAPVAEQPARPAATRRPRPLRLTRRGRAVVRLAVVIMLVLLTLAVALSWGRSAEARPEPGPPVPVRYHVVLPGETLWGIAAQELPGVDRRDAVARIVELNALGSAGVSAGQRLAVPAG
jgi:LysM domain